MNNRMPVPADQLEKYSSAITLSDMEIFVFPELLYSLVLANILSPKVWAWREHPWFAKIDSMTPYRRVLRLKQFIIDHYAFNLDLDTWGLTTKERELERFRPWMDEKTIAESNALFGYEGDKYYFSLDIRKHFGLDKYSTDAIPYWKTETVEAMDAFLFKPGYPTGAGECVSLSTLYAAAMFVVCKIPLRDIYLMATPLHSQNFIDVSDGVLTNNRRVVTKNMWFNGTELTEKAQRALRNEQITIVAHNTGFMHVMLPEATIDPKAYAHFKKRLGAFLTTKVDMEILANYLRQHHELQSCFQIMHVFNGRPRYIGADRVYHYEHSSSFKVSDSTREKLLEEIDEDEYFTQPLPDRIQLNRFDDFFRTNHIDLAKPEDVRRLESELGCQCTKAHNVIENLIRFAHLEPHWPDRNGPKTTIPSTPIQLDPGMSREEIEACLAGLRATHPAADLAFYAYRDLGVTDWAPFLKAAFERNPVSIKGAADRDDEKLIGFLQVLPNESIYDGRRMAQPDEVWNYGRGDGLERALCLANIWKARHPGEAVEIEARGAEALIRLGAKTLTWPSSKGYERIVKM